LREILACSFRGPRCEFAGERFVVRDLPNLPPTVQRPGRPIHVGGAGERYTLPLVARHADVWNCPTYALARRRFAGPAGVSMPADPSARRTT